MDSDEQIVDPEFANRAMAKWFATRANVREMHQPSAVGKGVQLVAEPDGQYVKSKVVDPVAVRKVLDDIYSDYSVGIARPRIVRDPHARNGRIIDGEIVELSLVDRGANYNAHFAIAKRAKNGGVQYVGQEVVVGAFVEPDAVKQGTFTHSHMHMGPNGIPHKHPHTHSAATPPHDEFHEGQPHAHSHQEESVTDAKPDAQEQGLTPPDAAKAAKCGKCGGAAFTDGKCDKCGAAMPAAKGADLSDVADDVQDLVEDAQQLAEDAGAVSGADDADKAAAPADEGTKPPFEGAAPPFAKKPPKKSRSKKVTKGSSTESPSTEGSATPRVDADKTAKGDDYQPRPYHADPDETVICPNCGKHNDVDAAYCDQCGFELKGADNVRQVGEAAGAAVKEPDTAPTPAAKTKPAKAKPAKAKRGRAKKAARVAKVAQAKLVKRASGVRWELRLAHDAACPAYSAESLKAAYPSLEKNGVAAALGPMAQQALYSMLANEVQEDGGSGNDALECHKLAKAYHALCEVLALESGETDLVSGIYAAAHAQLHAAFKQANSLSADDAVADLPKPSDPPKPGQFQRPYLRSGLAAETAVAHDVSVHRPNRPVEASDFQRDALGPAEGRERSFADKFASVLLKFHDAVTAWRPGLCRMGATSTGTHRALPANYYAPDISGNIGLTEQPAANFRRPPDLPTLDTRGSLLPSLPSPAGSEQKTVASVTEAQFSATGDVTAAIRALSERVGQQITKIATIEAQYEQLASQGDPVQRAVRGATGFLGKAAVVSPAKARRKATRQERKDRRRQEEITWQMGKARLGEPDERAVAIRKLANLGVDVDAQT